MAEVLSQSEIDALLSAVSTGSVETEETSTEAEKNNIDWITYDIAAQEKVVQGKLAAFPGIHDRFARFFRLSLSKMLKKTITVNHTHTDFIKFGEYLTNILLPTSINVFVMPQFKGHILLVMSSKLTYALIDAYYGGNERSFSKIGGKEEFTNIEANMISKIAELGLNDLKKAWQLNYPLELEFVRAESNPQFVGVIHGSESVAAVTFEVEFENLSGPLVLIVQLRALDSIQQELGVNVLGELIADAKEWEDHWLRELETTELGVKVELGNMYKTLTDIHQWKKGEEIILLEDAVAPLKVLVQEQLKYKGLMGSFRGNRAVSITEVLQNKPDKKDK